jgi:hypothetical protein
MGARLVCIYGVRDSDGCISDGQVYAMDYDIHDFT